jgi:UDP-2,3-diacylglucosamine hydrolase
VNPPSPSVGLPGGSRFLPDGFDASRPVVVIAGRGLYPKITVDTLRQAGRPVRLIAFDGETAPELVESFPPAERVTILVGQLGHMLKALRRLEAGSAIMAGQIRPRRLFQGLHPDLKAITLLATLKERNAATIFGAIAREIEAIGVRLLDARAFLDH